MSIKSKVYLILLAIILLASFIRFYKLSSVSPSLNWDEAAVGYNSYTIANYGKDEYGKPFPLYFRSFGEGKNPVHIYIGAIFTKLLGLNEFSTRFPAALFGVFNVLLIYFLAKLLIEREIVALGAAFFLAISPYNIHFSHFNHEANFALFFFMLGLVFFYLSVKKGKKLLTISLISFLIGMISYNAAKVFIPFFLTALGLVYFRQIILRKKELIICIILSLFLAAYVFLNPQLSGIERYRQTAISSSEVNIKFFLIQYFYHFHPTFLFISGDDDPKLSVQSTGEFYKIDALFLILGLIYLIKKRSKEGFSLIVWAMLAPIPSSLVLESPHAGRAMFMMGSWNIVAATGLYFLISLVRKDIFKWSIVLITTIVLSISTSNFLKYYFGEYGKRYAIDWQYGMKQVIEFVKNHKDYEQVYMTEVRDQPYIFFLFYLKIPLREYLNSVYYNNSESKSSNNVSSFDNFYFGGWNKVESLPNKGVLYILTPSEYDGLKHRREFDIKKLIKYPNGTDAFYLISAN